MNEEKISLPSKKALALLRDYIKALNESPILDRHMEIGMDIIDQSAYYLSLNDDIKALAVKIYFKMHRRQLIRGTSTYLGSLASVYAACRRKGIPITLNDISHVMDTPKKQIAKQFRKILFRTGINLPLPNYEAFIIRYGQELKINGLALRLAIEVLRIAQKKRILIGKDPAVIATSLIYLASLFTKTSITQLVLSEQALITEVSIRNNYKKILKHIKREKIQKLYNNIRESSEEGKGIFTSEISYDSYHFAIPKRRRVQKEICNISPHFSVIEKEDGDQSQISVCLPGVPKQDIGLSVIDCTIELQIKGKQKLQREINLEKPFDPNRVSARLEDGVLTILVKYNNLKTKDQEKQIILPFDNKALKEKKSKEKENSYKTKKLQKLTLDMFLVKEKGKNRK